VIKIETWKAARRELITVSNVVDIARSHPSFHWRILCKVEVGHISKISSIYRQYLYIGIVSAL